jgi:hypothetical protein
MLGRAFNPWEDAFRVPRVKTRGYQGLVALANGDVNAAKSAFEEQAQSSGNDGWDERARKYLRRLSGTPSPENTVTLQLSGFRDARFVAVEGITEAATYSFLVRTSTG